MADADLEDQIEEKKEEIARKKREKKAKAGDGPQLDPYIDDPVAAQQERFSGTTSDASTRAEGTVAADVPPDPDGDPNKPSDAENYDFPPQGDVDISTVEVIEADEEVIVAPTIEDWVVLDGSHEQVPEALDGRRAVILQLHPLQETYTREEWDELGLTVRTRDDYSATLYIPTAAVKEIHRGGVNPQRN